MVRKPTPEERALWAKAMVDAKPLRRRGRKPDPSVPEESEPPKTPTKARKAGCVPAPPPPAPPPAPPAKTPVEVGARLAPGIDKRTAERFRKGQREIEGRLDLHGMTQDAAWRRLVSTIERAHRDGKRALLVITGKGSTGGGVLRATVPRWLTETPLKPLVLAHAPAQPKDGGSGALYVLLRRRR
ncbi:MAG: DNA mismatch repair protein MutS [Alphaproteobacteria bacterium]|nr:DNA mismatch repair protein MutS [Alphaproteobacteria bacterium]